ncbi:hypothetical protein EMCRGX_G007018 [Ephydatia muelleri]
MTSVNSYQRSSGTETEPWKEITQLRDELNVVRQQYEKERRECEKLRAQLVAEKGLREQFDRMLALEVANNMEESEAKGGLFGKLRALTGLTTVHKLELGQDLAQREDENLKQLTKIQQLTIENERLQHKLDLLKFNTHQEDPQSYLTHQLKMENEQLKQEVELLRSRSTQHSNGDHMIHPGTQPTNQHTNDREWPTCNMTAPVESSFYQQRGNPHPQPQPFLTREQSSTRAHLEQGQHQFQFQSGPPPLHVRARATRRWAGSGGPCRLMPAVPGMAWVCRWRCPLTPT